jgi:ribosome biogenesis GTPase A
MIKKSQINKVKVTPIKLPVVAKENILGYDLFPEIYSNIFLCAKKKSGKTSTINHILRKCADKRTTVIVFCSTYTKDKNWINIKESLEKREIPNEFYMSIK